MKQILNLLCLKYCFVNYGQSLFGHLDDSTPDTKCDRDRCYSRQELLLQIDESNASNQRPSDGSNENKLSQIDRNNSNEDNYTTDAATDIITRLITFSFIFLTKHSVVVGNKRIHKV